MNGNSPAQTLRDDLETAQAALQAVRARVRCKRLLRWALGEFHSARLEDALCAVTHATEQVDALTASVAQMGRDSGLVRGPDGRLRKRDE